MDQFLYSKTGQKRPFNRYYLIDHKVLFLTGFFFYLICPYILGINGAFSDYPGVGLFQQSFQRIPPDRLQSYMLITLSWIPAFFLGHFFFKFFIPGKRALRLYPADFTTRAVTYLAIPLFFVLVLFVYVSRGSLFGSFETYDVGQRGKLSTLVILYDFFLIYQLVSKQKISFLLASGTILNALFLLLAGGRLTALQCCLVFLLYKTSFAPKRWTGLSILAFALAGFLVGSFIGISRVGAGFSFERAFFSLAAEPLFTWFSTNTFLASNAIPLFNMPFNFMTSFFNLVPNTLFHARQFVVSVPAMGYTYENPFGADSLWTNLVINFGAWGSFLFVFITGFMLNFLRHLSENNRFWSVYYILVCAMLPFEFFRTGFFILNKELFFNFLFLPGVILFLIRLINWFQNSLESYSARVAGIK
ncbi:O-antigen polymerase [Flavitalea flava]